MIVLDTNVALDLLVFDDPACAPLRQALDAGCLRWIATAAMREEFARVLGYPVIAARLARMGRSAQEVLAAFDARVYLYAAPPPAALRCGDPDDQVFIELALAHRARLVSKDKEVLSMRRQLQALGVRVMRIDELRIKTAAAPAGALDTHGDRL